MKLAQWLFTPRLHLFNAIMLATIGVAIGKEHTVFAIWLTIFAAAINALIHLGESNDE